MVCINMHVTLIIALVLATVLTQARDIIDCADFCKTASIDTNDGPWQSNCNCSPEYPSHPRDMELRIRRNNILPIDGIYYEPAEIYPAQKISLIDPPFYILNPNLKFYESNSLANTDKFVKRRVDKPSYYDDDIPKNSKIYKNERIIANDKRRAKTKANPLNINVSGGLSVNEDRKEHVELDSFSNAQSIEKDLLECLDLHLLACFLQNNNTNEFKKAWNANKYEKYGNLTENDLKIEIKKKCSQPAKVLKESLKEIKEKYPQKTSSVGSREKNTDRHANYTLIEYDMKYTDKTPKVYETTTENLEIVQYIFPAEKKSVNVNDNVSENLNSEEIHFLGDNKTISFSWTEKTNLNEHINLDRILGDNFQSVDKENTNKTINTGSTTVIDVNNEVMPNSTVSLINDNGSLSIINTTTSLKSNYFNIDPMPAIEHKPLTNDQGKLINSDNNFATKTITDAELLDKNFRIYDDFNVKNIKTERKAEETTTNHDMQLELKFNGINTDSTFADKTSTVFVEENTQQSYFGISTEAIKHNIKNQTGNPRTKHKILHVYEDSTTSTKNLSERRNILMEEQLTIPKIISIEFPNDTAISNVNGTEQMPNIDFLDANFHADNLTEISRDLDMSGQMIVTESPTSVFSGAEKITKAAGEITGKLGFIFGRQNIPARFVQNTDGNLNLGIDGHALCEELEIVGNKSVLIKIMCNCFRFDNNCTDSSFGSK